MWARGFLTAKPRAYSQGTLWYTLKEDRYIVKDDWRTLKKHWSILLKRLSYTISKYWCILSKKTGVHSHRRQIYSQKWLRCTIKDNWGTLSNTDIQQHTLKEDWKTLFKMLKYTLKEDWGTLWTKTTVHFPSALHDPPHCPSTCSFIQVTIASARI